MTTSVHLLLDLDGTIIVDQKNTGRNPAKVTLLPGVMEGLKRFRDAGSHFYVVTNQGGIALGIYSEADFLACLERTKELLAPITLDAVEYCPHAPDAGCSCRKPATGMWENLQKKFPKLNNRNVIMIGDKDRDIEFGNAIGCPAVRVRSDDYPDTIDADMVVDDLTELADRWLGAGDWVMSIDEAATFSQKMQRAGKKVVTTNGAFDLLHGGHRFLFSEARKHGDILIVGVNSDTTVRKNKGNDRPIDPQAVRALNAARYSDAVFIFDEADPREWLKKICPNVHVNAETYGKDCVEAPVLKEIGAELVLVPVKTGLGSTTQLLKNA